MSLQNRWKDSEIEGFSLLQTRVYSSRLLGQEPSLVLHGGGNTSFKDRKKNFFGEQIDVLYVKGSGVDLAQIQEDGFAILEIKELLKLHTLDTLSDEAMDTVLRRNTINENAPRPSIETLLHAFLPSRFIDHTHSDAILVLSAQENPEQKFKQIFGNRVAVIPYIKPGFLLAKACFNAYQENPKIEGMILLQHGIVSFGETAKESYNRMLELVNLAERNLKWVEGETQSTQTPNKNLLSEWLIEIRKTIQKHRGPCVLAVDTTPIALLAAGHKEYEHYSDRGPLTPDHVTRTKPFPLVISMEDSQSPGTFSENLKKFAEKYDHYFKTYNHSDLPKLDSFPRVVLIPGVGLIGIGATAKEANICKDIGHQTARSILTALQLGDYRPTSLEHVFELEYWAPQLFKLNSLPTTSPLSGKVAVVTGGASGIGLAITKEFLRKGCIVYAFDINEKNFTSLETELTSICKSGNFVRLLKTDVCQRENVSNAFEKVIQEVGGVDILVVNAGIFPASNLLEEITDSDWKKSFSVNMDGAFYCVSEALKYLKKQKNGGDIVFIASKNVPAPGKGAGAYSIAKAAQTQLARVCALEGGADGIRVNTLHPHLIFDTGIWTEEVLEKRAKAYQMTVEQYKTNNLLKTSLSSVDVANAAFALVSGYFSKTTGAQIPLDGGSDRTL